MVSLLLSIHVTSRRFYRKIRWGFFFFNLCRNKFQFSVKHHDVCVFSAQSLSRPHHQNRMRTSSLTLQTGRARWLWPTDWRNVKMSTNRDTFATQSFPYHSVTTRFSTVSKGISRNVMCPLPEGIKSCNIHCCCCCSFRGECGACRCLKESWESKSAGTQHMWTGRIPDLRYDTISSAAFPPLSCFTSCCA